MEQQSIISLLQKQLSGTITEVELAELEAIARQPEAQPMLEEALNTLMERSVFTSEPDLAAWQQRAFQIVSLEKANIRRMPALHRWGWAAAAAVGILLGIYYWPAPKPQQEIPQAAVVAPGTDKAILTLADGTTITLDSTGNREILQGGTTVRQHGGRLEYAVKGSSTTASFNTLNTPAGGTFRLILPDGTQVWLNAASSIRYPVAFNEKERRVEVTGEVYFETAKNAQQPFVVDVKGKASIEVLGTAFNINAYGNEPVLRTTLLNGTIKVNGVLLKPGQQAQVAGDVKVTNDADLDKVMAWKNGLFNFNNSTLEEVMHQLERWYDIEVIYEGGIPAITFWGEISRRNTLQNILHILKKTDVHYRLEGNKRLIVTH